MNFTDKQIAIAAVAKLMALAVEQEASGDYEGPGGADWPEGEHGWNAAEYLIGESNDGDELRCMVWQVVDGEDTEKDYPDPQINSAHLMACMLARQVGELLK